MNPTHSKLLAECDALLALRALASTSEWDVRSIEKMICDAMKWNGGAGMLTDAVKHDAAFIAAAHRMADLIQSLRTALSGQGEASADFANFVLLAGRVNNALRELRHGGCAKFDNIMRAVEILECANKEAADYGNMREAHAAPPSPQQGTREAVAYRTRRQAGEDYQYFDYSEVHGVEPLYTSPFSASPHGLLPETAELVNRFANALAEKFYKSQVKYGYDKAEWQRDDWSEHCRTQLMHHITKGDPRDVAAYCAFMWHHGWSTAPQEARPVELSPLEKLSMKDWVSKPRTARDEVADTIWAGIMSSDELARTRKKLSHHDLRTIINIVLAAHPPASPPSVPGFVLVPVEPTDQQFHAYFTAFVARMKHYPTDPVNDPQRRDCFREGYHALLNSAPQPPPAAGQWMAIESAPRDKRVPLLLIEADGRVFVGSRWYDQWRPEYGDYSIEPTHWMPLPSSPTQPAGATGEVKP